MDWNNWNDETEIGRAAMESGHREIGRITDQLATATVNQLRPDDCSRLLNEFVANTMAHFAAEAQLMAEHHDADAYEHAQKHANFIQALLYLKAKFDLGALRSWGSLTDFLDNWLADHSATCDAKLAQAISRSKTAPAALLFPRAETVGAIRIGKFAQNGHQAAR